MDESKDESKDERQQAIEACSCPWAPEENVLAPKCQVENAAGTSHAVLFVKSPTGLYCKQSVNFGSSHICVCKNRLHLYKTYGI